MARCFDCEHFAPHPELDRGDCQIISKNEYASKIPAPYIVSDDDRPFLMVPMDFGCVLFEPATPERDD